MLPLSSRKMLCHPGHRVCLENDCFGDTASYQQLPGAQEAGEALQEASPTWLEGAANPKPRQKAAYPRQSLQHIAEPGRTGTGWDVARPAAAVPRGSAATWNPPGCPRTLSLGACEGNALRLYKTQKLIKGETK